MRIVKSIDNYILGSFLYNWKLQDRPRVFYHQTCSYLDRFLLKRKSSNKLIYVLANGRKIHFRENWFDPRSIGDVFKNDYNSIDPDIFKGLKIFIDVGANLGLISACAKANSPNCQVFCFEALRNNSEICKLNNPEATVENMAVGSKSGSIKLLVDNSGFMASSLKFGYDQIEQIVNVVTLDEYFGKLGLNEIDLIKIDVEGMEVEVIKGGEKTIRSTNRVVAELHSDELVKEFSSIMANYGFSERKRMQVEKEIYISDWINKNI